MKPLLFIFILFLAIPVMAQEDKPIEVPQIAVKVGLNKTIDLDGLSITFLKVIEDSRCPRNVECVWAGEAKVLVRVIAANGDTAEKTLKFSNGAAVVASIFNKELQFLQLNPYPDASIEKEDRAPYTLLTRVVPN